MTGTTGFCAYVTWCKVLLRGHLFGKGQHFHLHAFDVGFRVESEVMWEVEQKHNVAITSN